MTDFESQVIILLESILKELRPKKSRNTSLTTGSQAYEAYATAYHIKYGTEPIRNKIVNSIFKKLNERLGEMAPYISGFYLDHPDYQYVKSKHDPKLLLRDCEKLATEWKTGNKMTHDIAKSVSSQDFYKDQLKKIDSGEW